LSGRINISPLLWQKLAELQEAEGLRTLSVTIATLLRHVGYNVELGPHRGRGKQKRGSGQPTTGADRVKVWVDDDVMVALKEAKEWENQSSFENVIWKLLKDYK